MPSARLVQELEPRAAPVYRVKVTPRLVWAILAPYVAEKLRDQLAAVLPISVFLFLFQWVVLRQSVTGSLGIAAGLACVILGLMLFMDGLRLGLMPLGENIGSALPEKATLFPILGFAFILGVAATFAEPAISTLQLAGENIRQANAPLLYELLGPASGLLVASVAIGVGIATLMGTYRFVRGWSLKVILLPTLLLTLVLSAIAALNVGTANIIALAWDTGAVTTGPVTVPLVLALGIGVASVLGKSDSGMGGFGIVTLASLWPVAVVLAAALAIFYASGRIGMPDTTVVEGAASATAAAAGPNMLDLFAISMRSAAQAIIPLAAFLYFFLRFVLREQVRNADQIFVGLVFALVGLLLFNMGLSAGLSPLGQQVGSNVPMAFAPPTQIYGEVGGRVIAVAFAFVLGYGATLAEPALNALGLAVEDVTAGAFKKTLLMQAVAFGVALGLGVGLAKIMFNLPIIYLVIPGYILLTLLTLLSEEKYVNIGWDSAGVTTGPITVPLVLAMGLGIGGSVGVADGFGMLAMASIGPILSVLCMGLIVSKTGRGTRKQESEASH